MYLLLGVVVVTLDCQPSGQGNHPNSKHTGVQKEEPVALFDSLEYPLSGDEFLEKDPNKGDLRCFREACYLHPDKNGRVVQ